MVNVNRHDILEGAYYIRLQLQRKGMSNFITESPERVLSIDAGFLVDRGLKVNLQYYLAVTAAGKYFKPMLLVSRRKYEAYREAFVLYDLLDKVFLVPYNRQATGPIVWRYFNYILRDYEANRNKITEHNRLMVIADEAIIHKTTEIDQLFLENGVELLRLRKESHVLHNPVERPIKKIKERSVKFVLDFKEVAIIFSKLLKYLEKPGRINGFFTSSGFPNNLDNPEEI